MKFFAALSAVSLLTATAVAGPLTTVEDLYRLSQRHTTLEGTLSALPQVFRENYVLIYNSPSAQGSSFAFPRVLLFNEDASLVITFNGDPNQRGYQHLETVQYLKEEGRWEFYDLSFEGEQPELSGANPRACTICHQDSARTNIDPRPNWEPYNIWPRVYGSLGGKLTPKNKDTQDSYHGAKVLNHIESHLKGYIADQNQEEWQLQCFIREQVMGEDSGCYETPVHDSSARYKNLNLTLDNYSLKIDRGVHDFSRGLSKNNFARVHRLMTEQPIYETVKYALGALLKHHGIKVYGGSLTPPYCERPLSDENLAQLLQIHTDWVSEQIPNHFRLFTLHDLLNTRDTLNVTRYIDLLFGPYSGPEFKDWSMDFMTGGRFIMANQRRFRASGNAAEQFSEVFFGQEEEMVHMSCSELSKKANQHLSEFFNRAQ